MPGFLDVSNMSDLEIKRLGQIDDDYNSTSRYRARNRSTPARDQVTPITFTVSDVWAAACAADRVNNGYIKEPVFDCSSGTPQLVMRRNRDVMMEFLYHPDRLLVEDVERGEACREFLQNDITFRLLQGKVLNSFDDAIRKTLAIEESFNAHMDRYELAIVASLPASVARSQARQNVDQRVKFARGGYVGRVGAKVTLTDVEVLSATLSKQWNIYWIRGITDQDQVVVFSNKESFNVGTHLSIQGKVKAHRDDNLTQLNYVKVL